METALDKLFAFLKENAVVFYAGIGMGIYRCALEWPVWFNNEFAHIIVEPLSYTDDVFLIADVGKVIGLVCYIIVCYLFDKRRKSTALLILPSLVTAAGYLCPVCISLGLTMGDGAVIAALVVVGCGIGMLFAQWIEFCGLLPPVKVIQTLALSYVVRFLVLPALTTQDLFFSSTAMLVLVGSSFVLLSFCFKKVPASATWVRSAPQKKNLGKYGTLFLCVCVFAFAYGLGEGSTHLAHTAFEAGIGKLLPSLFILVLAFKLGDRFDRNILYAIALPLMTAGLISIEFLHITPSVSQVLISAAYSSFNLLVYTLACSPAYQSRTSAMFAGVCIRALALIAADVAVVLMRISPSSNNSLFATVTIIATLAVCILAFLPQFRGNLTGYQFEPNRAVSEQRRLEDVAASAGLSQRETTVFQLLVMGKSTAEISEELFISKGAVRAHNSRIYEKFNVHSREDFNALFSE